MKPSILFTVIAECFLSSIAAVADFDPSLELNCETSDGLKIIANDALVGGQGKAIAGSIDRVYTVTQNVDHQNHIVRLTLDFKSQAQAHAYTVDLDLNNAKLTTRLEGSRTPAQYYLVPAAVRLESGWENQPSVPAKCFQPAS